MRLSQLSMGAPPALALGRRGRDHPFGHALTTALGARRCSRERRQFRSECEWAGPSFELVAGDD